MSKDRTTATVTILGVIAILIMGAALFASSQNNAALAEQTAVVQTAQVPTDAARTQAAANQQATQAVLNVTATEAASLEAVTAVALATDAAGADIQTTDSGLQYRVVTEGTGAKPTADNTVSVNYRGVLLDGTEFDSSYKRGTPSSFAVNGVIPGLEEGLQLMTVGSTYIFIIPSELGYGAAGAGNGVIPPDATLIFQVDLLSIQ